MSEPRVDVDKLREAIERLRPTLKIMHNSGMGKIAEDIELCLDTLELVLPELSLTR